MLFKIIGNIKNILPLHISFQEKSFEASRIAQNLERMSFDLPDDLIFNILSKSSVKSLSKCKSVCKSWYALIEAPHFIRKHRANSTLNPRPLLFHSFIEENKWIKTCHCGEALDHRIELDFPGLRDYYIIGVSEGIVLAFNFFMENFTIANPMTRQFRRIYSPFRLDSAEDDETFHGFGVFGNSQYMVRVIYSSYPDGKFLVKAEMFVMNTGGDKWRDIHVRIGEGGALLKGKKLRRDYGGKQLRPVDINGIFYWQADMERDACVISFDINQGLFDVIRPPFDANLVRWDLGEIRGELGLTLYHGDRWFELFVLNANMRSWSVKHEEPNIPMFTRGKISVYGCIRNEELVLEDRFENHVCFLLLDLSTGGIKCFHRSDFDGFEVYLSSESLIRVS